MIILKDVKKSFNGTKIIKGMNLEVNAGEKIAIIGPSGCGKSTLLRLLIGLQRPDEGEIWVDGEEISSRTKKKSARSVRNLGCFSNTLHYSIL